ncbi:MAG TPA: MarR family winged helix-turn-helix transcriptional regulator [Ramlibacter sp.]|jgi:DNA-binding MarR family transcriptional regulator|uniref:MarR family winged helix-turn-helix transcriptional regulator n=1 Tax=Ramlibacter sp. TaxID=1917967 RepID=UPI002D2F754E|nr:MarR family winged helix-turn-helix transcriptional regulator [Ramlibacter sp.]HZY18441.1 MarR family winged helix-turn-helix transcriptional regulator [Ramlibacter sp.]
MADAAALSPVDVCHCLAVRQAARWISQLYDQHLAACGLSSTQYAVLSQLQRSGPSSIAALAEAMVMDRTTMTRSVTPLERDGLLAITAGEVDRRRREVTITAAGRERLAAARPQWRRAQHAFEQHFGAAQAQAMRTMLRQVPTGAAAAAGGEALQDPPATAPARSHRRGGRTAAPRKDRG